MYIIQVQVKYVTEGEEYKSYIRKIWIKSAIQRMKFILADLKATHSLGAHMLRTSKYSVMYRGWVQQNKYDKKYVFTCIFSCYKKHLHYILSIGKFIAGSLYQ